MGGAYGLAVQSDGRIEGHMTCTYKIKGNREIKFTGTISDDNRVILTFTIPGMLHFFDHGYESSTEITGSFEGIYDPVGKFISGRFQYNQERIYDEHWDMFGEVTSTEEFTNIEVRGKLLIAVYTPVILIPGWAHSPKVWRDFAQFYTLDFVDKPWVNTLGLEWRFGNPFAEVELPQSSHPNTNAQILAIQIEMIRERRKWTNTKIDLVAHSQGGLDARAYIRNLGDKAKDQVRSLTMIATPNNGTVGAHWWNLFWTLRFKTEKCVPWLTPGWAEEFNERTPLASGMKYYTIAGSKWMATWPLFLGHNDGVVPVSSVRIEDPKVEHLGTFPYEHSELVHEEEVYRAVVGKIDPPYSEEPNSLAFIAVEDVGAAQPDPRSVIVDDVNDVAFVMISDQFVNFVFTLQSPNGDYITPESLNANVSYDSGEWLDLQAQAYIIREPATGVWQAHVGTWPEPYHFLLIISAENTFALDGSTDSYLINLGEDVTLKAQLSNNRAVREMEAEIVAPDGLREIVTLYDDGVHEDNSPGDGLYGNSFTPSLEGEYIMLFSAKGIAGDTEFSRSDLKSIFVVASGANSF
jgi:pimeloyl-ACP methyl ester carboxylesterase